MNIKKRIKRKYYLIITICLVLFLFLLRLNIYNKTSNKKLINYIESNIKKEVYNSLNEITSSVRSTDLFDIYENKEGEILYVDYNLNKSKEIIEIINQKLDSINENKILSINIFSVYDNVFLANLGPKVNFKINYFEKYLTTIYTKVTNYGLNNALVEAYIKIEIESLILTPLENKSKNITYDLLIDSKIINGRVPNLITSNSNLLDAK